MAMLPELNGCDEDVTAFASIVGNDQTDKKTKIDAYMTIFWSFCSGK
ncbi:hypothetical protein PQR63_02260 [Herbaspirillum rhizosphaerae]|uniref:Uncharacterized protein n=1 Tax=Herbaspirillum rhizosphaerae TaxID=346179 RepID=A0ABW8Z2C6_9BURK